MRRLGSHPSIALWCGDNELIGALTWFEESRKNRDRYLVDYDRLNRTIEEAMRAADAGRHLVAVEPVTRHVSFGDAWHDDPPATCISGRSGTRTRTSSTTATCGRASARNSASSPSRRSAIVRSFATSDDDLNIASPVMEWHQKNAGGNARIAETMFRYFRFPDGFDNFVYLSQIQQGWRSRPRWNTGAR